MTRVNLTVYIDGANLYNGVKDQGWLLDYRRFHTWLTDKFAPEKVYLFIGLDPMQSKLYQRLQEFGYILVFKPTVTGVDGKMKGNCDVDMVLQSTRDTYETDTEAVFVSSDGDFYSVVEFLMSKGRLSRIVSPSPRCSILLKRTNAPITYLHEIRSHVQMKKPPARTEHRKGLSRGDISK